MNAESAGALLCLFPRLLGVVYALAFTSLAVQVPGLYGSQGILPIAEHLGSLRQRLGKPGWRWLPSLFWLGSDRILSGSAWLGVALAVLLVAGFPPLPLLLLLWLLYLSFVTAGEVFLSYQWDALLLEVGFMTIFLPLAPGAPMVAFTYRFLLFRFIFSSGWVKLASNDPTWRDLTALCYHYETQPLPNRLAWYAHQQPRWLLKLNTIGTFVAELAVPCLFLGPTPLREAGFLLLVGFQGLILLTGNYGFFNLLTVVMAVPLLDDRYLALLGLTVVAPPASGESLTLVTTVIFAGLLGLNLIRFLSLFLDRRWLAPLLAPLAPYLICNHYGLFAVMTTDRFEFVIEGGDDAGTWRPYEFRWKPGDPSRPPLQVAPHQPRLDWQMWFAALNPGFLEPWVQRLLLRILEGSAPVLALLGSNPFPAAPPRFVRVTVYRYHFSSPVVRRRTGQWWERSLVGTSRPLYLQDGALAVVTS